MTTALAPAPITTFTAGQKVTWLYTTPGGWNWVIRVPATVVKATKSRVCIDAELKNGGTKRRYVKPENLVVPTQKPAPDQYIGLPAFFAALHFWAKLELHSQQVKAANARAVEQMKAIDCSRFKTDNSADDDERFERRRLWREWKG